MSHVKKMEVIEKEVRGKTEPRPSSQSPDETWPFIRHRNSLAPLPSVPEKFPLSPRGGECGSAWVSRALGSQPLRCPGTHQDQTREEVILPQKPVGAEWGNGGTQSHKHPLHMPGALFTSDSPAAAVSAWKAGTRGERSAWCPSLVRTSTLSACPSSKTLISNAPSPTTVILLPIPLQDQNFLSSYSGSALGQGKLLSWSGGQHHLCLETLSLSSTSSAGPGNGVTCAWTLIPAFCDP